jgi:hypothetical protein
VVGSSWVDDAQLFSPIYRFSRVAAFFDFVIAEREALKSILTG